MSRAAWFLLFLVSGFCGLLYEVVWLRLAMAAFGVTTAMISIVLSVFMGGLALGSWAAGAGVSRLAAGPASVPLRLYGAVELVMALSGAAVPATLAWGRSVLASSEGSWGSAGYYALSSLFVVAALLPFCTCMGATFPLALAVLRRTGAAGAGQHFSFLYVANVIGATLGTLATGFVLIEWLGFRGALAVGALLNSLLACAALVYSLRPALSAPPLPAPPAPSGAAAVRPPESSKATLVALFGTGFVSMAQEVIWTRQFTPYLGTVVYTFALILAVYLTATFAGAMLYRMTVREARAESLAFSPVVWTLVFVAALLPLAAADPRFGAHASIGRGLLRVTGGAFPFSALLGFLTPLLVDRWSRGDPRRAGLGYAVNVLGCIAGPVVAGFVALPLLGQERAIVALALPFAAGAGLLALRAPAGHTGRARAAFAVGLAAAAALVVLPRSFATLFPRAIVRHDSTATVIAAGSGMHRRLLVNGMGITSLTPITKTMAHLPMTLSARPPEDVLVICLGMGTTYRSVLSWGQTRATAVELVPSVADLLGFFHADGEALARSPRGEIVIDDGRRFLERSSRAFDVIIVDPPPPVEAAGSSLLYSREFYEAAARRLRDGGMLQQWIPAGEPVVVSAFVKAVRDVFPHVRAYASIEGWGIHVLGSRQPIPSRAAEDLVERLPPDAARDLVEWGPTPSATEHLGIVLANEIDVGWLMAQGPRTPALTDDRPINEYFFLRRGRAL
jgi:predicted membrane-bound spermidine synthase